MLRPKMLNGLAFDSSGKVRTAAKNALQVFANQCPDFNSILKRSLNEFELKKLQEQVEKHKENFRVRGFTKKISDWNEVKKLKEPLCKTLETHTLRKHFNK